MKSHFCFISRQFVSCCCHNAPVLFLMTCGAFCLFREEFPLTYCFGNTEIKFVSKLSGEVFYDSPSVRGGSRVRCHIKTEGICFCVYVMVKNKTDAINTIFRQKFLSKNLSVASVWELIHPRRIKHKSAYGIWRSSQRGQIIKCALG